MNADSLTITFHINDEGPNAHMVEAVDGTDGLGEKIADALNDAGIYSGEVVVNL